MEALNDSPNFDPNIHQQRKQNMLGDSKAPGDSFVRRSKKLDPPDLCQLPLNETSGLSREPKNPQLDQSVSRERRSISNDDETNRKKSSRKISRRGKSSHLSSSSTFTGNKKQRSNRNPRSNSVHASLRRLKDSCPELVEPQLPQHVRFSNAPASFPEQGVGREKEAVYIPEENVVDFKKGTTNPRSYSNDGASLISATMGEGSASTAVDIQNNAGAGLGMNQSVSPTLTQLAPPPWQKTPELSPPSWRQTPDLSPPSWRQTPRLSDAPSTLPELFDVDEFWRKKRTNACCRPGPIGGTSPASCCYPDSGSSGCDPCGRGPSMCCQQPPGGPPGCPLDAFSDFPIQLIIDILKFICMIVGLIVVLKFLKDTAHDYLNQKKCYTPLCA